MLMSTCTNPNVNNNVRLLYLNRNINLPIKRTLTLKGLFLGGRNVSFLRTLFFSTRENRMILRLRPITRTQIFLVTTTRRNRVVFRQRTSFRRVILGRLFRRVQRSRIIRTRRRTNIMDESLRRNRLISNSLPRQETYFNIRPRRCVNVRMVSNLTNLNLNMGRRSTAKRESLKWLHGSFLVCFAL